MNGSRSVARPEADGKRPEIKAITFDVGGTLIEPFPSVGHIYADAAEEAGRGRVDPGELNVRFGAAWKDRGAFDYSRTRWRTLVERTFSGLIPAEHIPFERLYDRFNSPAAWREFPDVRPVLTALTRRGFPIGIISNWDERLLPLLATLGQPPLGTFFDRHTTVVSHQAGFTKPAPGIFHLAARQLHLPPEYILHVGDSRTEDLEGARKAGFQSVLLDRSCSTPNTIPTLNLLLQLLEKA